MSLPSRGAWIEIHFLLPPEDFERRSPRGERGLKSTAEDEAENCKKSLPSRGAWIEIGVAENVKDFLAVAPLAGSVD